MDLEGSWKNYKMELDSEGLDSQVEVVAWKETSHNENCDDYEVEKITGMRLVKVSPRSTNLVTSQGGFCFLLSASVVA